MVASVLALAVFAGSSVPGLARDEPGRRSPEERSAHQGTAPTLFSAAVLEADLDSRPIPGRPPGQLLPQREHPVDRWLAKDKAAHFAASAFLSAFGYYVARREREWRDRPSQRFALAFGFAFGVAKEVRDARCPRGTASWKDLVADALGCFVGTALVAVPDGVVFGGEP